MNEELVVSQNYLSSKIMEGNPYSSKINKTKKRKTEFIAIHDFFCIKT